MASRGRSAPTGGGSVRGLGPAGLGGLASGFGPLFGRHLLGSCLSALQSALATERNSGRVFPLVRIEAGGFPGRFVHQGLSQLIYVCGALT